MKICFSILHCCHKLICTKFCYWMCIYSFYKCMYTIVIGLLFLFLIFFSICMKIWDRFREKGPSAYYKICYKNAIRLNRYTFRTVNAIDVLFSTLHSTPFLYVDLHFHVLHKFRADVMRPDYPWGSKLPHLQVGASNSFQIQCVCRGVLSLLIFSVR